MSFAYYGVLCRDVFNLVGCILEPATVNNPPIHTHFCLSVFSKIQELLSWLYYIVFLNKNIEKPQRCNFYRGINKESLKLFVIYCFSFEMGSRGSKKNQALVHVHIYGSYWIYESFAHLLLCVFFSWIILFFNFLQLPTQFYTAVVNLNATLHQS